MCGIVGYIDKNDQEGLLLNDLIKSIKNRGPDSIGKWSDKFNGVYIGHTRLSILDLTDNGNQPMVSKKYIISFNGEIYNHLNIRKLLERKFKNIKWVGNSDTETICKGLDYLGIEALINKLNGMFAICIFDKENKDLFLVRDRFGEKPIFYSIYNDFFIFGSTIKSISLHPKFKKSISNDAFESYMRFGSIRGSQSIYENTFKLAPSTFLKYSYENSKVEIKKYWYNTNFSFIEKQLNIKDIKNELHKKINTSVKSRMLSDVPIGGFLSGGIDSSLVCALMQKNQRNKIKTFTIGFEEEKFNESKDAEKISKIINTDHNEIILNKDNLLDNLEDLSQAWDEPFADPSKIPTLFISKITSKNLKVVLSGDGADELFGGYNRYRESYILQKIFKEYSPLVSNILSNNKLEKLNKIKAFKLNNKIKRIIFLIKESNEKNYYLKFLWFSHHYKKIVNEYIYDKKLDLEYSKPDFLSMTNDDLSNYLPNNILTKIDRASMFYGLEARCPYLDHNLVEWILNLDNRYRFNFFTNKKLLKLILSDYIPKNFIPRNKKGFTIPLSKWLKTYLKDWASSYIFDDKCYEHKLLNKEIIVKWWEEHQNNINEWHRELWLVICFNSWYIESKKN